MPIQKQSILLPLDGGLSKGDVDEFTVTPANSLIADNVVFREEGSVRTSPHLTLNTVSPVSPHGSLVVLGDRATLVAGDVYDVTDPHAIRVVASDATTVGVSTVLAKFSGSRMVQPHSATTPAGYTMVASWNMDSGGVDFSIFDNGGAVLHQAVAFSDAFNPRVCIYRHEPGGDASSVAGWRFLVGAKLESGGFIFERFDHLGNSYGSVTPSGMAWGNGTNRNGWAMHAGRSVGNVDTVIAVYPADDVTHNQVSVTTVLLGVAYTFSRIVGSAASVLNSIQSPAGGVIYALVGSGLSSMLLIRVNQFGSFIGEDVINGETADSYPYNSAGMAVTADGAKLTVAVCAFERYATQVTAYPADLLLTEVNNGDPRSFPLDNPSITESQVLGRTMRVGTMVVHFTNNVAGIGAEQGAPTEAGRYFVSGAGVIGNGYYVGADDVRLPYEWGFPCATGNVKPGDAALVTEGHPFPNKNDVLSGYGYTIPFTPLSNQRSSRWRPRISPSKYPQPYQLQLFSLGASIFEQEGQARLSHTSHNATIAYQEGSLGLVLSHSNVTGKCRVDTTFLSTRLSTRSNYALSKAKGPLATPGSGGLALSDNVDAVCANDPRYPSATFPSCDLNVFDGSFRVAVTCKSDSEVFGRVVSVCTFTTDGAVSVTNGTNGNLVSFGGSIVSTSSNTVQPAFLPRPSHVAVWGSEAVDLDTFSLTNVSSVQSEESHEVQHAYIFIRYRAKLANGSTVVSQLSPPLAVHGGAVYSLWEPEPSVHDNTTFPLPVAVTYWKKWGPYALASAGAVSLEGGIRRRAIMVPVIPWLDVSDVELDVYMDDYGTDIGKSIPDHGPLGLFAAVSRTTWELSRVPNGQPRYVGTVKPSVLFGGEMSRWMGFYFGNIDRHGGKTWEIGNFAPAALLGKSEPVAADALEAVPAVPATPVSLTSYQGRVLALCSDGREEVWVSKPDVPGVSTQFSDELVFRVPPDGGKTVGCSAIEERLVVFKRDRILASSGLLPDAVGDGGSMSEFSTVTSEVGCISGGSILLAPQGVVFESAKGFCMLTPGGGVEYIGGPVSDLSGVDSRQNCVSSAVNVVTSECYFAMASNPVAEPGEGQEAYLLVWNYKFNKWSRIVSQEGSYISKIVSSMGKVWCTTNDPSTGASYVSALAESPTAINAFETDCVVSTGWFAPNGLSAYMRVNKATLLGRLESGAAGTGTVVKIRSYVNFQDTVDHLATFNLADVVESGNLIKAVFHCKTQKCQSMRFEVTLENFNSPGVDTGRGPISLHGLQLDIGAKAGSFKQLASTKKG